MKKLEKDKAFPDGAIVVVNEYMPHALFYVEMANDNGAQVLYKSTKDIERGNIIIVKDQSISDELLKTFELEFIAENKGFYQYKVK